ncbi:MAG: hypothetical protein AB1921_15465, partial [Thermodesulfobacteriota bacterium]
VSITGNGFLQGAGVKLSGADLPDIFGENISVSGDGQVLVATFELTDVPLGARDVVVANPDGSFARLDSGFTVEETRPARTWVDIVGRGLVAAGREQKYLFTYGNSGNVDTPAQLWVVGLPSDAQLFIISETVEIRIDSTIRPAGDSVFLVTQDFGTVLPIFIPKVRPNETGVIALGIKLPVGSVGSEFTLGAWIANP